MNLLFLLLFLFPSGVSGSRAGPSTQMPVALLRAPMVLLWVLVDVVSDELWRGFVFRIRRQPLLMHWRRLGRGSIWSNIPYTEYLCSCSEAAGEIQGRCRASSCHLSGDAPFSSLIGGW